VSIVYDGDGNRVQETVAGVTTKYLVGEVNPTGYAQVFAELSGTNSLLRGYEWGLQLEAVRDFTVNSFGIFHYYGYDGRGSVRWLTDSSGSITDTYDFDAFGNLIASTGSTPNNYMFAGEQFDPALGIYYNRARYYDQRQGRFWTADTWEGLPNEPESLHRYLYASANPVNRIDPSGHFDIAETLTVVAIATTINSIESVLPDTVRNQLINGTGFSTFVIGALTPSALVGAFALSARFVGQFLSSAAVRATLAKTLPIIQKLCFAAGTPVLTKNGPVPIEQIRVRDEVLSRNMTTGKLEYKKVTQVFAPKVSRLIQLSFAGNTDSIKSTPSHPFYTQRANAKNSAWISAVQIRVGDSILSAKGDWVKVVSTSAIEKDQYVYNFEVAENHNYYVGSIGVLVHNGCDALRAIAENAASKFGILQCVPCADALETAFKSNGISGTRIELEALAPEGRFIFSEFNPDRAIADNGKHVAIEVEGLIFDNISKGIPRADWEASLATRLGNFAQSFKVTEKPF